MELEITHKTLSGFEEFKERYKNRLLICTDTGETVTFKEILVNFPTPNVMFNYSQIKIENIECGKSDPSVNRSNYTTS